MSGNPHLLLHWREALVSTHGPRSSTTRHVLLTLSIKGDTDGSNMYPSISTLADMTRLTERTVCTHLELAERDGWIQRAVKGTGRGWRRHEYHPVIPPEALKEIQHQRTEGDSAPSPRRTEPDARGAEPDDTEVLKEVQSTSSVTSPKTSPPPPEGEPADADPDRMGADELVATWINALGSRPAGVSKQAAVAKRLTKAYDRTTIIRAVDGIQQLYPHSDGEPWDLFDLEKKFTKATTARSNGRREGTTRQADLDEDDLAAWNPISGDKATRRRGGPS